MSVYAIEPFLTSVFTLSQVTGTNFPYKLHLNFVENFGFLSILTAFFFFSFDFTEIFLLFS